MKKEKTVKTHTRKTKSGKTVTVKQHTAKYDAAEQAKDIVKKAGAGAELERVKKAKMQEDPYKDFDFTAEEFAEWYEGTGSKADKKVEKALRKTLGKKAYNDLNDAAADSYKKGGAAKFFTKEVSVSKSTAEEAPAKSSKETTSKAKMDSSKVWFDEKGKINESHPKQKRINELMGKRRTRDENLELQGLLEQRGKARTKWEKEHDSTMEPQFKKESKVTKEKPSKDSKVKEPKAKTPERAGKSGNLSLTAANRKEAERILRDPAYTVGFMKGKNGETIMTYSDESTGKKKLSAKAKKEREQWADETMQEFFGPKTAKPLKEPKKSVAEEAHQRYVREKLRAERSSGLKAPYKEGEPRTPRKRRKKNTPEEDAALDATLAEIRERNRQPYQVSRKV